MDEKPKEVFQPILETLVRLADEMGYCVTGYVFGINPPAFIHFGNARESYDPDKLAELHAKLDEMYKEKFDKKKTIELTKPKDWSN